MTADVFGLVLLAGLLFVVGSLVVVIVSEHRRRRASPAPSVTSVAPKHKRRPWKKGDTIAEQIFDYCAARPTKHVKLSTLIRELRCPKTTASNGAGKLVKLGQLIRIKRGVYQWAGKAGAE